MVNVQPSLTSIILLKYLLLCSFHVMAKDSLLRSHDHPHKIPLGKLVLSKFQEGYNTPRYRTPQAITLFQLWKDSLYSLLLKVYVGVCCSSVCWWPTLDKSFQPLPFGTLGPLNSLRTLLPFNLEGSSKDWYSKSCFCRSEGPSTCWDGTAMVRKLSFQWPGGQERSIYSTYSWKILDI